MILGYFTPCLKLTSSTDVKWDAGSHRPMPRDIKPALAVDLRRTTRKLSTLLPAGAECCSVWWTEMAMRNGNNVMLLMFQFKDKQERPESAWVGEPERARVLRELELYLVLMCNPKVFAVRSLELLLRCKFVGTVTKSNYPVIILFE